MAKADRQGSNGITSSKPLTKQRDLTDRNEQTTPPARTSSMSVVGNNRVGIPIVVLHDAEGAVVEVETKKGELIRGLLFEAEDQMNLYIKNVVITDGKTGAKRKSNQVYIRGHEIVFIVLPDMLKHAPMFNRYVLLFGGCLSSCLELYEPNKRCWSCCCAA